MKKESEHLERSLTEACIQRSKTIVLLKAALLLNRQTQFFVNRTPPILPSQGYLKELEKEITYRIDEFKMDIAKYLTKIIAINNKKISVGDSFCFSSKELKDGYVFFYKRTKDKDGNFEETGYILGVLVLGEFDSKPEDKIKIEPGMIFEFNDIKSYFNQIKGAIPNTLVLTHALRKIKQNETKRSQI